MSPKHYIKSYKHLNRNSNQKICQANKVSKTAIALIRFNLLQVCPSAPCFVFALFLNLSCLMFEPVIFVALRWYFPLKVEFVYSAQNNAKCTVQVLTSYRKIPKISPGACIFQKPFLRGLFLEGLIFGGVYLRRDIFAFQNRLG